MYVFLIVTSISRSLFWKRTGRTRDREHAETRAALTTKREHSRRRDESRAKRAAAAAKAEQKPNADADTEQERRQIREKPAEFRAIIVKCATWNLLSKRAHYTKRETTTKCAL